LNILIIISRFSQGKQSKQKSRIKGTNILYSAVIRKNVTTQLEAVFCPCNDVYTSAVTKLELTEDLLFRCLYNCN